MIDRNIDRATSEQFDLIVIGGGIQGATVALEASRRGISTLLLERHDFGNATSWNSLRILHGGFRYLQSLDLGRFATSVREQAWWARSFPELTSSLGCLLPLYNRGLRRTSTLRAAIAVNDLLAKKIRNQIFGKDSSQVFPKSRMMSNTEVQTAFSACRTEQLRGGVVWNDLWMRDPQRLLMELLHWAANLGSISLNYIKATGLVRNKIGKIVQVKAECSLTQRQLSFQADRVVICCGQFHPEIGGTAAPQSEYAFAFNFIVDRQPLSPYALAIAPPIKHAHTYFLVPYHDRVMIGTVHVPNHGRQRPAPTSGELQRAIDDLNQAVPTWKLSLADVSEHLGGWLPAKSPQNATPRRHPQIHIHPGRDSAVIEPVKYTTARDLAEKTLRQLWRSNRETLPNYCSPSIGPTSSPVWLSELAAAEATDRMLEESASWYRNESVTSLEDLVLRRADLPRDWERLAPLCRSIMSRLEWSDVRQQTELAHLQDRLMQKAISAPPPPQSGGL